MGGTGVKLREYEYILAIAREKNMVRAARSLYVSQPALSKLLAGVEAELGVQLFERNHDNCQNSKQAEVNNI